MKIKGIVSVVVGQNGRVTVVLREHVFEFWHLFSYNGV